MNTPTVNRTILDRGHLMPGRRFKQSLRRVSAVRLKSAGAPGSGMRVPSESAEPYAS